MILYGWSYVSSVAVCVQVSELSTEGQYPNTLCAVDIATDWVACRAVLGKGQQRVGGVIHRIGQTCPSLCWAWIRTTAASSSTTTSEVDAESRTGG